MKRGVLVVGLGSIGSACDAMLDAQKYIYSHSRAFSLHPEFELLAGVDHSAESRAAFQERYRRPAFANVATAFGAVTPEVVVIAVSTAAHLTAVEDTFNCGRPTAILCEKPLALAVDDARRIVELCEQHSSALYVNYIRRADPAVAEIGMRLKDGRIPTPIKGVVWYSKGLFNNGSHFLDLVQHWLGPAQSFRLLSCQDPGLSDPEPDFVVQIADSHIVFLSADESAFSHYTVEFLSSSGQLRYEAGGESITWRQAKPNPALSGYRMLNPEAEQITSGLDLIQYRVADQLLAELQGRQSAICTGQQALRSIEFLASIRDSI